VAHPAQCLQLLIELDNAKSRFANFYIIRIVVASVFNHTPQLQIPLAPGCASGYQNLHEDRFEEHCLVVGTLTRP
jgi:hypothetical protein